MKRFLTFEVTCGLIPVPVILVNQEIVRAQKEASCDHSKPFLGIFHKT